MEKSIETIWKEGFLSEDLLVAPKINDLYNQKSMSIIEKIKRMMRINIIAIVILSLVVLIWWYFLDVFYIGVLVFLLLNAFALFAKKQMDRMREVDQAASSYDYLKSFQGWIRTSMDNNTRVMRLFYPMMFLAAMATTWFSNDNESVLTEFFANRFPELAAWAGIPVVLLVAVFTVAAVMAFFADKIYRLDVNLVYGQVFKKLDEIILDMEELRA